MRNLVIPALLCHLVTLSLCHSLLATGPDLQDYVLLSYELTPAEEGRFNRADGQLSPFWQIMVDKNLDRVHLDPEHNITFRPDPEGFVAGMDDAQLTTWSAWGDKGLYFLFKAMDDDFVGYVITGEVKEYHGSTGDKKAEKANDAIELRLCHNSSEELINNYEALFPYFEDTTKRNGNAKSMAQYGLRFGGDQPDEEVEVFRRNPSYDPANADSTDWQSSLEYLWERYGVDDEAPAKGFEIEVVMGEANVRYQEWRMAWDQVGMEGAFTKPTTGKQIAMILGYNDVDQGYMNNNEDVLRWRNAEPFWRNPKEKGLGAWGDLEFSGPLATAESAPDIIAVRPFMTRRMLPRTAATVQRFTPDGRMIRTTAVPRGIVIERAAVGTARRRTRF